MVGIQKKKEGRIEFQASLSNTNNSKTDLFDS